MHIFVNHQTCGCVYACNKEIVVTGHRLMASVHVWLSWDRSQDYFDDCDDSKQNVKQREVRSPIATR